MMLQRERRRDGSWDRFFDRVAEWIGWALRLVVLYFLFSIVIYACRHVPWSDVLLWR